MIDPAQIIPNDGHETRLSVRPARADDAAALARLAVQLGYDATPPELTTRLPFVLPRIDHAVFAAVDEHDVVVGWIHVAESCSLLCDGRAEIPALVVDESARGRGIGTRLLAHAERWAVERGLARMSFCSRTTRERAHRFYIRAGYRQTKTSFTFERELDPR